MLGDLYANMCTSTFVTSVFTGCEPLSTTWEFSSTGGSTAAIHWLHSHLQLGWQPKSSVGGEGAAGDSVVVRVRACDCFLKAVCTGVNSIRIELCVYRFSVCVHLCMCVPSRTPGTCHLPPFCHPSSETHSEKIAQRNQLLFHPTVGFL